MALGERHRRGVTGVGRARGPVNASRSAQPWFWLVAAIVAAIVVVPETAFAQCPMCRTALKSPEGQRMIAALRDGIYLLLAAPFAAFGTVAVLAVRRFQSLPDSRDETTSTTSRPVNEVETRP